ncbi:hypothetical protein ANCDUO_18111 [Ancylostoma duodenale]|uniref:Uncharacterized protein n=1 Tax=Ancylostoma duodenale TaxID=51022 RepID=A0A0C2G437_9BILA|nr:hypothetical protein ANCDUO_18111 [Ancylostoma duodenale]
MAKARNTKEKLLVESVRRARARVRVMNYDDFSPLAASTPLEKQQSATPEDNILRNSSIFSCGHSCRLSGGLDGRRGHRVPERSRAKKFPKTLLKKRPDSAQLREKKKVELFGNDSLRTPFPNCGGGVSQQLRRCLDIKCSGHSVRFRVCNEKASQLATMSHALLDPSKFAFIALS